jgi:hypothetical protein
MSNEIGGLLDGFLRKHDKEEKSRYWKNASKAFRLFWKTKVLSDETNSLEGREIDDLDPIVRLLDVNATRYYSFESTDQIPSLKQRLSRSGEQYGLEYKIEQRRDFVMIVNAEGAARTMIPQNKWYKIFYDLKSHPELRQKLDEIFEERLSERRAVLIDELKAMNSDRDNLLTKPAGIALSGMMNLYDPDMFSAIVSLYHRKQIADHFQLGQISDVDSYGAQIVKTNDMLLNFNQKYGANLSLLNLGYFMYETTTRAIWDKGQPYEAKSVGRAHTRPVPTTYYWLDLWTPETWEEARERGFKITGFRSSRRSTVSKIKPGDLFVCYLTKLSRFCGVLKAKSEPYNDPDKASQIWKHASFPCLIDVEPLVTLDFLHSVPSEEIVPKLSIAGKWRGIIRGSPARIPFEDGELIRKALESSREEYPIKTGEISIRTEEIDVPTFVDSVNLDNLTSLVSPRHVRDPEFIKIALIIENCSSTNWVLPSFQRYFDWKKEDIRSFLESIFNGYYVGSFLLWDAEGEPELGVQTIKGVVKEEKEWKKDLVILDGQQRITSLYYAACAPNSQRFEDASRWRDTKIFREHPLYFYIDFNSFLRDPRSPEIIKISNKKMSNEECFKSILFPMYELEEHGRWLAEFSKFLRSRSQNIEKIDQIREAIRQKLYCIWAEYEIPYISLPKSMGINQVTEIFEQLNTKGKPLNVFDLLVARLFRYEIKLKALWDKTCKEYPTIFRYAKAPIEKIPIYILQAISLYYHESSSAKRSDILDIHKNIYAKNPEYRFEDHWNEFSRYLNKALEKLENLRDGFGVKDEKEVPFESMIPVLAALLRMIDNQENKASCYKKLDKWYWSAVFTNAYSQAAESQMTTDFREVRDWFADDSKTPRTVTNMLNDLPKLNLLTIQSNWNSKYRGTMSLVALEGAKDFETDQALENARENDKDHLFPKSVFGSHININSVLNMTWMSDSTNRYIKNYKKPSAYVAEFIAKKYAGDKERFNGILRTHLIGEDALKLLLNDQFDQFLIEREKTVIAKLRKHMEIEDLEAKPTMISPETPFTNKEIFWNTLRSCQGYIHWVDKYFTKPGLELISHSSLDSNRVREVKVLMCPERVDEDFRKLFKDLKEELKNKRITFEIRAITDPKIKGAFHDRWILSESVNYNVTSPDVMARRQYSEILPTFNRPPPFDEWWNSSKDIIADWDEIRTLLNNSSVDKPPS